MTDDKEDPNAHHLRGQPRPTIEQVAWVFAHLDDHRAAPGSYRFLIYERMGFRFDAYSPLYVAGGMNLSNAFVELEEVPKRQEFLLRLAAIIHPQSIPAWLDTPNEAFRGRKPQELINGGELTPLFEMLYRLENGEAS